MSNRKRGAINWVKGDKLLRMGQKNFTQIAKILGCTPATVMKRARDYAIERDYAPEIKKRINKKLLEIPKENKRQHKNPAVLGHTRVSAPTEKEINEVVDNSVDIVLQHRKEIERLAKLEQKLLSELTGNPRRTYITQHRGDVIKKQVVLNVAEKAQALSALSMVQARRIQLEREAYGIADKEDPEDKLKIGDVLKILDGKSKGLPLTVKKRSEQEIKKEMSNQAESEFNLPGRQAKGGGIDTAAPHDTYRGSDIDN